MSEKKSPDEFNKVIKDFYKDILLTFPEYKTKLGDNELDFLMGNGASDELFKYCCKKTHNTLVFLCFSCFV